MAEPGGTVRALRMVLPSLSLNFASNLRSQPVRRLEKLLALMAAG
jgi:hypothetical protein